MMNPLPAGRSTISKRVTASLVVLALAAPAALASSTSASQGIVHTQIDRSGTVLVTGFDGGVALTPAASSGSSSRP
jgi:hypothetical protein